MNVGLQRARERLWIAASLAIAGCSGSPAPTDEAPPAEARSAPVSARADRLDAASPNATSRDAAYTARPQMDGRAFPDKVLALTWDDGPDANTLALARYLRHENVAATFFVVSDWDPVVSDDPGEGTRVFDTGHERIPILGDLVGLGHRVGNHTLNHVLLHDSEAGVVGAQLRENQARIDPFITNELRLFRAPGGAWNTAASAVVDGDPALSALVGPVRWDVDRKDWDGSVSCRSSRPAIECDRGGPGGAARVKPRVMARRYAASIDEARRGIVLLHDRVGHVGSRYALEVAEALIPELKARGYVFAAPVLRFSPLTSRSREAASDADTARAADPATIRLGDVDGDGRDDVCARGPRGVVCATSADAGSPAGDRCPTTALRPGAAWDRAFCDAAGWASPDRGSTVQLADVDGDGRDDVCARGVDGIACALATGGGGFGALQGWSASHRVAREEIADFSDDEGWGSDEGYYGTLRFADVDGDGRDDVCGRSPSGIECARSQGNGFDHARLWLPHMNDAEGWLPHEYSETIQLGDVDGDGRADVCGRGKEGIVCALSNGRRFARARKWSAGSDFGDGDACPWAKEPGYYGTIRLGDVNGDGRSDVCGRSREGVVCALSTGRSFTRATNWLPVGMRDEDGWLAHEFGETIQLGDVNGDGRADICGRGVDGIVCGLAP